MPTIAKKFSMLNKYIALEIILSFEYGFSCI